MPPPELSHPQRDTDARPAYNAADQAGCQYILPHGSGWMEWESQKEKQSHSGHTDHSYVFTKGFSYFLNCRVIKAAHSKDNR